MDTEARTTAVVTHVSWKSIFAGAFIASAIQYVLAVLGLAIGLANINPASSGTPGAGLGIGAAIWWIIITIIALYFGGWVSSRLAGILSASEGMLHGLVTWALFALIGLYVMTSAIGGIIGGGLNVLKNAAQVSTQAAQALPPGVRQDIQQQAQQGQQQLQQQTQQMSPEEKQAMQQKAEQQAKESAEKAAQAASTAAWGVFIMLVLGAIAAALGGRAGRTAGPVRT